MKQAHVSRCTSAFFLVRWTNIVTHTACVTKEPTKKSSVRVLPKRVVNSWSNLDLVHLNGEQKTTHTASINSPLKTDTDIKPSKFSACKWLKTQVPRTILVLLQSTAFRESAAYPIPSAPEHLGHAFSGTWIRVITLQITLNRAAVSWRPPSALRGLCPKRNGQLEGP